MKSLFNFKSIALFCGIASMSCSIANAALVSLTIDPTQSSLSLSGVAFGLPYGAQAPGSLVTSLSGTISADLTAGVFTFSGGSAVTVDVNPLGPFSHAPYDPGTGTSSAGNYGVVGVGPVPGFGTVTVNGVYRNLLSDIVGGTAQNGFSPAGVLMKFNAGQILFAASNPLPLAGGTSNVSTANSANTAAGLVTWNGTTLTLPVTFATTGSNRAEQWNGVIVANIPEPSSMALLSIVGLGGCIYRRRNA